MRNTTRNLVTAFALAALVVGPLTTQSASASFTPGTYSCATGLPTIEDVPTYEIDITGAVINGTACTGEVIILAGPTSIGASAFEEAYYLTSIDIPEGVTSIGVGAFLFTDSLTEITFPASLTSIGNYAFDGDFSYGRPGVSLNFLGDAPTVGSDAWPNSFPLPIAYIQPDATGFQANPAAMGYGEGNLEIYWEGVIVRPTPPYGSSNLFREWQTPLLPTQNGPMVGHTVYASAFERYLDSSLLDPEFQDDLQNRPEEYVYRITRQENDPTSSVDQQSHLAYTSLTKDLQDAWYGEMGFDTPMAPGDNGPYQFSWRAFMCLAYGEEENYTFTRPTSLAVSNASRDDTTDSYVGDQRRHRDFMFRDLTNKQLFTGTRTLIGTSDVSRFESGSDSLEAPNFSFGVTEVTGDCGQNNFLVAMTILDESGDPITSKSFEVPKNLKLDFFGTILDEVGSEGITIGVTGSAGPMFNAALFGLATITSAAPPASATASPNYFVTLDANGGSGSKLTIGSISPAPLPSSTFSKKGFVFSGWNTKANGTGLFYADKATFPYVSSATLYAQWSLARGKKFVPGFAGNDATLTAAMKKTISGWVRKLPANADVVCEGSTLGTRVTVFDRGLAQSRAKRACRYVVSIRKDISFKVTINPSSDTNLSARHVRIIQTEFDSK